MAVTVENYKKLGTEKGIWFAEKIDERVVEIP